MRHMSHCTTVPVPKVLAYCTDGGGGGADDALSTFVILEYIDGKLLSPAEFHSLSADRRFGLYTSLADVYVQLRRQEFPLIGKPMMMGGAGAGAGAVGDTNNTVCVGEKTASLEMNMMQLEGLDPLSIQNFHHDESGLLQSANTYTRMLLSIGYNAFLKSRNAVAADMGLESLYNHFLFSKHVQKWIDPSLDQGPFVLVHGDLHLSNLLVNDRMRIVGLLDWEWSRVVPVQYFAPPLWLSKRDAAQLANPNSWQLFRRRHFAEFLTIVKSREEEMYGNSLLHDEWAGRTEHAEPLIANALENWTEVDWFIHQHLSSEDPLSAKDSLLAFSEEDPLRSLLAEIKEQDHRRYQDELDLLIYPDDDHGQGNAKTVAMSLPPPPPPPTLGWMARLKPISQGAGIIGATIATAIVMAAV
ncbi:hypothetical protein QQS21_009383 [Conoideocrella luteorostrata]|uniref:Aminoglycoside phosphotransferase domain-containing protein n=1 Tax=Conoideocrella luteorostrata TaxID=1105319 RepID=A0AAJ0CHB2_9HYPO|nr:hypothetical protein QQS21_009383 [Conoideocrella luteorostrata]